MKRLWNTKRGTVEENLLIPNGTAWWRREQSQYKRTFVREVVECLFWKGK